MRLHIAIMNKFIFDVDGTLTPSRGVIDPIFKEFFNTFCRSNQVFLVTGSDKPKTIEQIGEDTYNLCHTVYQCNGNDVWQSKKHLYTNEWRLSDDARDFLCEYLTNSAFPLRTGLHFEHRPGMCNFSVVGRNANQEQRKKYRKWDLESQERVWIADKFNLRFPELEAKVGGETGIDISPKGFDKSQVIKDFDKEDETWFFGDAMHEDGNDLPLALVVKHSRQVTTWKHTWEYLQILQDEGIAG
jgi:phosphomannomutase